MDTKGDEEDGGEAEEDDGVDEDGRTAGLHVAELHHPPLPRQLKQQPRAQQHEQHHRYNHRSPVRHLSISLPLRFLLASLLLFYTACVLCSVFLSYRIYIEV
ncbi:hypothetical protein CDL15_Pgr009866 [Punica granatum]|uniref:Uncharacterized protein n=1 Tax=Punica granatum TaxID=22663 RepID=A0A218WV39_PUNGR|nr:hypothetical protein CDL15_Pgr009866 [Punica granatum]